MGSNVWIVGVTEIKKYMKKYKVKAPIGITMIPNEIMTEKELRDFIPQLVQDSEQNETWKEKAKKDPIDHIVEWLKVAGYEIEEIIE